MESRTIQLARRFMYNIGMNMCLKMIHVYWDEHVPEDDSCVLA